jgi:hypothetical protein
LKIVEGKAGIRYMRDGKFISKDKVTTEELNELYEQTKPDPKACLFCGKHSKLTRFVNMQTLFLCEEHYHDKNIGQIAQKLREIRNV